MDIRLMFGGGAKAMETITQKRAELKQQEKEIKKRMSFKTKADKFAKKINEMMEMNPVMFYYYRVQSFLNYESFNSLEPITNEEYYLELFEYLAEGTDENIGCFLDINLKERRKGNTIRPTLQELIELCVLFDIPFDENVLTETYNKNVYKEIYYQCVICYNEMTVSCKDKKNFCCFIKPCVINQWVNSCNCKILVCISCGVKINPKCCPLCRTPFQALRGIDETRIIDIEA